jgi:hypothetical protein
LLKKGWCQCAFKEDIGDNSFRYCAVGAYREAYRNNYPELSVHEAWFRADQLVGHLLVQELPLVFKVTHHKSLAKIPTALEAFNDTCWRRFKSVVALYNRAISRQLGT